MSEPKDLKPWVDTCSGGVHKTRLQPNRKDEGMEEGSVCGRDKCDGIIEFEKPENCSCHLHPPCNTCVNVRLTCPKCHWVDEGGEE